MKRNSFPMLRSFFEAINLLPKEIQAEIYPALMDYAFNGTEPEGLRPVAGCIFMLIRPVIDANNARYENGLKGGSKGKSQPDINRKTAEGEPDFNQKRTEGEPDTNQNRTESEPNLNQSGTETEPNLNRKVTEGEPDIDKDIDIKESTPKGVPKKAGLSSPIDYEEIKNLFNEKFRDKLPKVIKLDDERRAKIRARISEFSRADVLKVFDTVLQRPFLLGHNDRNWRADFDFIFSPKGFRKILEGGYRDDEHPGLTGQKLHTTGDQAIIDKLGF